MCSKRVTVVNFMMSPNREVGFESAPVLALRGAFFHLRYSPLTLASYLLGYPFGALGWALEHLRRPC